MIRRILKEIEKLEASKAKLLTQQVELQKKIDNTDLKIKNYNALKKEYEKIEKKFNNYINPIEETK